MNGGRLQNIQRVITSRRNIKDSGHIYILCGDVGDTQVRHLLCIIYGVLVLI